MQNHNTRRELDISGIDQTALLGTGDKHLKKLAAAFDCRIVVRGALVSMEGAADKVDDLERVFTELILLFKRNNEIRENDVETILAVIKNNQKTDKPVSSEISWPAILYTKDAAVKPKTVGQVRYFETVQKNDLIFVIGPAGTGKTYMAVAMAVAHLRDHHVSRIVLARPAVEAGESLGFLPGDLLEKVDPYLRPLYDALSDMIPVEKLQKYLETKVIEVVPLAYMRGRTLNNAFVILDEAQNTTPNQMKMFLTRLGINSKAIITGDITQIDLPSGTISGLVQVQSVLAEIAGVAFVYLEETDVVRHHLVRQIIKAYENFNQVASKE